MKRFNKLLLCLLLVFALLPLPAVVFAEGPTAAERGVEKLKTATNWGCIVLPKESSYLEQWKTLYGRKAWFAPSLFVEAISQMGSGVAQPPSLFEGTEVTVVAEENDMSCILYRAPNNKLYSGWIKSIRLLEEFPGDLYTLGTARDGDFRRIHEVENAWSDSWLPGTHAEHTAHKELNWGPRTVWVSDGKNWTALDAFPYPAGGAVRVQVWLSEPMTIAAVGTTADCENPDLFEFRQLAEDFLLVP